MDCLSVKQLREKAKTSFYSFARFNLHSPRYVWTPLKKAFVVDGFLRGAFLDGLSLKRSA